MISKSSPAFGFHHHSHAGSLHLQIRGWGRPTGETGNSSRSRSPSNRTSISLTSPSAFGRPLTDVLNPPHHQALPGEPGLFAPRRGHPFARTFDSRHRGRRRVLPRRVARLASHPAHQRAIHRPPARQLMCVDQRSRSGRGGNTRRHLESPGHQSPNRWRCLATTAARR